MSCLKPGGRRKGRSRRGSLENLKLVPSARNHPAVNGRDGSRTADFFVQELTDKRHLASLHLLEQINGPEGRAGRAGMTEGRSDSNTNKRPLYGTNLVHRSRSFMDQSPRRFLINPQTASRVSKLDTCSVFHTTRRLPPSVSEVHLKRRMMKKFSLNQMVFRGHPPAERCPLSLQGGTEAPPWGRSSDGSS